MPGNSLKLLAFELAFVPHGKSRICTVHREALIPVRLDPIVQSSDHTSSVHTKQYHFWPRMPKATYNSDWDGDFNAPSRPTDRPWRI